MFSLLSLKLSTTLLVLSFSMMMLSSSGVPASSFATTALFLNFQEAHPPNCQPTELEDWLESLVTLLGYFCLDHREHQGALQRGPSPTILVRLCNLPFR